MIIRPFQDSDRAAVLKLWLECGLTQPQNDPTKDIQRKLSIQPELFLVGLSEEILVAAVMAGYDGHRGWLNYLAVSPDFQRHGYGKEMVMAAEKRLLQLGCPKINIQIRSSNKEAMAFYRKIGFHADDVISLGKRIITDE